MVWRLTTLRQSAVLLVVIPACVAAAVIGLTVRIHGERWEVRVAPPSALLFSRAPG
jgi:hypothetical protein